MIDPLLSLALSMYSNPGVYALLLGSGVSRAARIPTGWEVTLDLIRKVAHMSNEDCGTNPDGWYMEEYGEEPEYSKLLDALVKSPAGRSQLLRPYFEPDEEEREQGLKVPTRAHKAIADLVADGYVRMIVTTNFDRLIQTAIDDAGIVPHVVNTAHDVEGMLPLVHARCTVVKVNGDYLDARIKNTPTELAQYDPRLDALLDRIFDEFGLIVCGWSGKWDIALASALRRCRNRVFATYWTARGPLTDSAKTLIDRRRAEVITISNADSFFQELQEKVSSLSEIPKAHPIAAKVAVATVKKYLANDASRIRLHDLVMQEAGRLHEAVSRVDLSSAQLAKDGGLRRQVERYEALAEILVNILAVGCYWGSDAHVRCWVKCLQRVAGLVVGTSLTSLERLRGYPGLLLLYSAGMASTAAKKYGTLKELLVDAMVRIETSSARVPCVLALTKDYVFDRGWAIGCFPELKRSLSPVSARIFHVLRDPFRELMADDSSYSECFARFEYMLALVYQDFLDTLSAHGMGNMVTWGSTKGRLKREGQTEEDIRAEIDEAGESWALLRVGFFDGSLDRLRRAQRQIDRPIYSFG